MIFPLMETITFALQTIYKTLNKLFESNAMVENFLYEKKNLVQIIIFLPLAKVD